MTAAFSISSEGQSKKRTHSNHCMGKYISSSGWETFQVSRKNVSEGWLYASVDGANSSFTGGWNKRDGHKPKITQTDGASLAFFSGESVRKGFCNHFFIYLRLSARKRRAENVQVSYLSSSNSGRSGERNRVLLCRHLAKQTLIWLQGL